MGCALDVVRGGLLILLAIVGFHYGHGFWPASAGCGVLLLQAVFMLSVGRIALPPAGQPGRGAFFLLAFTILFLEAAAWTVLFLWAGS